MTTSIRDVPRELLIITFELAVEGEIEQYARQRTILCLVCKAWSVTIRSTPSLWTRIHHKHSGPLNTLHLKQSQGHPLDVTFNRTQVAPYYSLHLPNEYPAERERASFREVCQHIYRWRTATIVVRSRDRSVFQLLSKPAPLLEDATVTVDVWPEKNVSVNLFAGQAERLQSLHLIQTTMPWTSGMLAGLRALTLERIDELPPSIGELMAILMASPQLSTLNLTSIEGTGGAPLATGSTVHLPLLQNLTLIDFPFPIINYLLSHIHPVPLRQLILHCEVEDGDTVSSLGLLITPFTPIILLEGARIELAGSYSHVSYVVEDEDSRLKVALVERNIDNDVTVSSMFPSLISSIPSAYTAINTYVYIYPGVKTEDLDVLFATIDTMYIIGLNVTSGGGPGANLQMILARLAVPEESTGSWFLPNLEHFSFDAESVPLELLKQMVDSRAAGGPGPFKSLTALTPRGQFLSQSEISALQSIVGQDILRVA